MPRVVAPGAPGCDAAFAAAARSAEGRRRSVCRQAPAGRPRCGELAPPLGPPRAARPSHGASASLFGAGGGARAPSTGERRPSPAGTGAESGAPSTAGHGRRPSQMPPAAADAPARTSQLAAHCRRTGPGPRVGRRQGLADAGSGAECARVALKLEPVEPSYGAQMDARVRRPPAVERINQGLNISNRLKRVAIQRRGLKQYCLRQPVFKLTVSTSHVS